MINKRGAHDDMIRIRRTISATLISGLTAHENYDILNKKIACTVGSLVRNISYLRVDGSTILAEKTGDNIIWYICDGDLLGFTYNGTPYYYVKNMQGDVYKVVDASGNVVASYTYDAWGKVLTATGTMADINPIRYRGYYYDSETGLYYLNSRYYDPETGRFINADAAIGQVGNVQGANMFAYCFNNPVNMSDPTGNWPKLSTIFAVVAVAAVVVAAVAAVVVTCGAAAPAMAVVGGGIAGGISAQTIATAAAVGSAAVTVAKVAAVASAASYVTEKAVEKTVNKIIQYTFYRIILEKCNMWGELQMCLSEKKLIKQIRQGQDYNYTLFSLTSIMFRLEQ